MKKVAILYKFLPHYREEFFNILYRSLLKTDIKLYLIYGKIKGPESKKGGEIDLEWAEFINNRTLSIAGITLYWQPCLNLIKDSDLIIVEQADKLLINYILMLKRYFCSCKFAFWGHGINYQKRRSSLANKYKRLFLKKCDWWFAYTWGVKKYLMSCGFPPGRITVVQNAIDTISLVKEKDKYDRNEVNNLKKELGLNQCPVGIYCGSIYREKRLDFLVKACEIVRKKIPTFELIIIGQGPNQDIAVEATKKFSWIHYLGPKFGFLKIPYFIISNILLNPGTVGLGILDSFVFETPIVTTNNKYHGPEIEYLVNHSNGLITENSIEAYAEGILSILRSRRYLYKLKQGCKESAQKYTVQNMVNNFAIGVKKALII